MRAPTNEWRVYGPPGCGKTTWARRQVERAVEKYGPDGVLVASFSKTAAMTLLSRGVAADSRNVGTLHAICYRALGRPPLAEQQIAAWNAEHPFYTLTTAQTVQGDDPVWEGGGGTAAPDQLAARYHTLRCRMVPRAAWEPDVRDFAGAWEAWKQAHGYIDFTDMIEIAYQEMEAAPGAIAVGILDEAQDCNPLDLALWRKWAARMEMAVIVGDDDQCIFGFRGATPEAFLSPPVADDRKVFLRQSHRLPRAVQEYAGRWIRQVHRREPKEYAPRPAPGCDCAGCAAPDPIGAVRFAEDISWRVPDRLIGEVEAQIGVGRTVMILASCSYLLQPTIKALREHGIPFHNPGRRDRGDWNPLRASRGVTTADRLLAYMEPSGTDGLWTNHDLKQWIELIRAEGALRRGGKTKIGKTAGIYTPSDDELFDWFEAEAFQESLPPSLGWIGRHAAAAKRGPLEYPARIIQRRGTAALKRDPLVTVGTIHSTKGDEADVVMVYPDLSRSGEAAYLGEDQDGVTRLFYVAFTRARQELVLLGRNSAAAVAF